MTTPAPGFSNILSVLSDIRQCGRTNFTECPLHDDPHRSLSLRLRGRHRFDVQCDNGCTPDAICKAINRKLRSAYRKREEVAHE